MNEVEIDFTQDKDIKELLKKLNDELFHISFFGHNLSALDDTLTGLAIRPYTISIKDVNAIVGFSELHRQLFEALLIILLNDCSRVEKIGRKVSFYFED